MAKQIQFEPHDDGEELVEAFSPEDAKKARKARRNRYPNQVIRVVNAMLAEKSPYDIYPVIYQDDVVDELVKLGCERQRIFAGHLLDFEQVYEAKGWKVTYKKPDYNASGRPYWTFKFPD